MRIVHINTVDYRGGAGRAMHRLHHGLQRLGQVSERVVRFQDLPTEPSWVVTPSDTPATAVTAGAAAIQAQAIDQNRTELSDIFFSFPYPGVDVSELPPIQSADILHVHWTAGFQSPVTLKKLLDLGKPVVWTLHDMWAFTGGCHSAASCTRYQQDCFPCPQLRQDPHHLPAAVLRDKLELWRSPHLIPVAPSPLMAATAQQSRLFFDKTVHVIPNPIDTAAFAPLPKADAKQRLGLPTAGYAIAFGAEFVAHRHKGGPELIDTVQRCLQDARFQALAAQKQLHFICLGHPDPQLADMLGVPLLECGFVDSEAQLRAIYSAADVFLQPSPEESFGNMLIEAMSCGTPGIAFRVGIAPEVIEPDVTGRVLPVGDTAQMAAAVLDFVHHPEKWQAMPPQCRDRVAPAFSLETQAAAYLKLYESLQAGRSPSADSPPLTASVAITDRSWDANLGPGVQPIFSTLAQDCLPAYILALQTQVTQMHQTHRQLQHDHQQMRSKHQQLQERQQQLLARQKQLLDKQKGIRQKLQQQQELKQKLANLRQRAQYGEATIEQLHAQLAQTQAEVAQLAGELAGIKSSKLWKTRNAWQRLKGRLGLKSP